MSCEISVGMLLRESRVVLDHGYVNERIVGVLRLFLLVLLGYDLSIEHGGFLGENLEAAVESRRKTEGEHCLCIECVEMRRRMGQRRGVEPSRIVSGCLS